MLLVIFFWGIGNYVKSGVLAQMKLKQMSPRRQKKAMKHIRDNEWEQDMYSWVWKRKEFL